MEEQETNVNSKILQCDSNCMDQWIAGDSSLKTCYA